MEQYSAVEKAGSRPIEINKVLKNTYLLLSATLLFSAAMAGLAIYMNVGLINFWVYLIGFFGLIYGVNKTANTSAGIFMVFALTGFLGFYTGPIVNYYAQAVGSAVVFNALAGTGLIFFALSGYVLKTQKDFTFMKGLLFAGLMVMLLGIVVFLIGGAMGYQMTALSLGFSAFVILLMSGFILYDTSSILRGEQTNYILATVNMYLNIWILFMHLLRLLAFFSGDD
jgi:modulator of FtsH protease